MRSLATLALLVPALAGCEHLLGTAKVDPAQVRQRQGEVRVYLEPLPPGAERLSFTIAAIAAIAADGAAIPLQLATSVVRGDAAQRRLPLAAGSVPPGSYQGLVVTVPSASQGGGEGAGALLVPKEPARIDVPFEAEEGRSSMIWLGLSLQDALRGGFEFRPALTARPPPPLPVPQVVGYCANAGSDDLTVFDRLTRDVFRATRTGRAPSALAIDRARRRLYVALAGEGEILVVDSATSEKIDRIRLDPGDVPRDLALVAGGTLLLSVNDRSNTVSFLDPLKLVRLDRIPVGEEPSSLVVDPAGVRAYVLNRTAGTLSVVDVANRAVVRTVRTDPEPLRAALSRDGRRLYVTHRGAPFVVVRSVPDLAEVSRVFLGRGTPAIAADPRTELVYLGLAGQPTVTALDPATLVAVGTVDVGGEPRRIVFDPTEYRLHVLVPSRRAIVVVDAATLEVLGTVDVGTDPADFVVMGAT